MEKNHKFVFFNSLLDADDSKKVIKFRIRKNW